MLDLTDFKGRRNIKSTTLEEVSEEMAALGRKSLRAKQAYDWIHMKLMGSSEDMNSLSKELQQKLEEHYSLTSLRIVEERVSQIDGTRKYLFGSEDGNIIESVWMQYHHDNPVYIPSQVGCRMGCRFYASTLDGLKRNPWASKMLGQIYKVQSATGQRASNVVVMGSGEPSDSYNDVIRFLYPVSHEKGLNISQRNLMLPTCSIVPGIRQLAKERLGVVLTLSPHVPNDEVRQTLIPIVDSYRLKDVLGVCRYYHEKTERRFTFEYSLAWGVNDSPDEARALARLIRNQHGHVNLIPVNPIKERDYVQSGQKVIVEFKNLLEKSRISVTIRREISRDIGEACGQLRRSYTEGEE